MRSWNSLYCVLTAKKSRHDASSSKIKSYEYKSSTGAANSRKRKAGESHAFSWTDLALISVLPVVASDLDDADWLPEVSSRPSLGSSNKRRKVDPANEHGKLHPIVQCAMYAAEMQARTHAGLHAINLLVIGMWILPLKCA